MISQNEQILMDLSSNQIRKHRLAI